MTSAGPGADVLARMATKNSVAGSAAAAAMTPWLPKAWMIGPDHQAVEEGHEDDGDVGGARDGALRVAGLRAVQRGRLEAHEGGEAEGQDAEHGRDGDGAGEKAPSAGARRLRPVTITARPASNPGCAVSAISSTPSTLAPTSMPRRPTNQTMTIADAARTPTRARRLRLKVRERRRSSAGRAARRRRSAGRCRRRQRGCRTPFRRPAEARVM